MMKTAVLRTFSFVLEVPVYLKTALVAVSWFGGPSDPEIGLKEGLAFEEGYARELTGWYCAVRTPVPMSYIHRAAWGGAVFEVQCPETRKACRLVLRDWGPALHTGKGIDVSPEAYQHLEIEDALGCERRVRVGLSEDQVSEPGPCEYVP